MEKLKFSHALLLLISGLYTSCALEPFPELPPETQTGAWSFGCLVNNELAFAWGSYTDDGQPIKVEAKAVYYQNTDYLCVDAQCQFGQQFVLEIAHPFNRIQGTIDRIRYRLPHSDRWIEAVATGYFHLTRMDTNVASGVFSFDLYEQGQMPIVVTKGRFDLPLGDLYQY